MWTRETGVGVTILTPSDLEAIIDQGKLDVADMIKRGEIEPMTYSHFVLKGLGSDNVVLALRYKDGSGEIRQPWQTRITPS